MNVATRAATVNLTKPPSSGHNRRGECRRHDENGGATAGLKAYCRIKIAITEDTGTRGNMVFSSGLNLLSSASSVVERLRREIFKQPLRASPQPHIKNSQSKCDLEY